MIFHIFFMAEKMCQWPLGHPVWCHTMSNNISIGLTMAHPSNFISNFLPNIYHIQKYYVRHFATEKHQNHMHLPSARLCQLLQMLTALIIHLIIIRSFRTSICDCITVGWLGSIKKDPCSWRFLFIVSFPLNFTKYFMFLALSLQC